MKNNGGGPPNAATIYASLLRQTSAKKYEDAFAVFLRVFAYPPFLTQYKFHLTRQWQTDFAWPERKLLVEIEGGIWRPGGGAHSHPSNIERDIEKSNAATLMGFRTIRVTPKMLAKKRWPELHELLRPFFV